MERLPKVLAIDDDHNWLSQVPLILEDMCAVDVRSTIDRGIEAIEEKFYDVILLDINFKNDNRTGLDIFRMIKAKDHSADVIVISGETNPQKLIQIMNAGITQFLPKPVSNEEIRSAIGNAIHAKKMKLKALNLDSKNSRYQLIGRSLQMQKLREQIAHVVNAGIKDVLLTGETGTEKKSSLNISLTKQTQVFALMLFTAELLQTVLRSQNFLDTQRERLLVQIEIVRAFLKLLEAVLYS